MRPLARLGRTALARRLARAVAVGGLLMVALGAIAAAAVASWTGHHRVASVAALLAWTAALGGGIGALLRETWTIRAHRRRQAVMPRASATPAAAHPVRRHRHEL